MSPVVRRVRAYFAPVMRATAQPALFDPAQLGEFAVDTPPLPWVDLGWVYGFARKSATKVEAVRTGAPAIAQMQVRTEIEATLSLEFATWGKVQLAVAAGTQQMNLLRAAAGAAAAGSGGAAVAATALAAGSTATVLQLGGAASGFAAGQMVAVDVDYAGATGFIGSGVSGAYLRTAVTDVDYVRRVTLNVARISAVSGGAVTLNRPLIAGVPGSAMKVSVVVGFCDREGSSFFQEWSGLFVMEGQQGDRVLLHYPRLQAMSGAMESSAESTGLQTVRLGAAFRALPVRDAVDGEQVVCFRSYLPA
jgi:hypothetical protein